MESHAQEKKKKILGLKSSRKGDSRSSTTDKNLNSNLSIVSRIEISHTVTYQPSIKKWTPKKRKKSIASSKECAREQDSKYHQIDENQEVDTINPPTRWSPQTKEKTKRYADTPDLDFLNNSADDKNSLEKRQAASLASFSPTKDMPSSSKVQFPFFCPFGGNNKGNHRTINCIHQRAMSTRFLHKISIQWKIS